VYGLTVGIFARYVLASIVVKVMPEVGWTVTNGPMGWKVTSLFAPSTSGALMRRPGAEGCLVLG